MRFKIRCLVRCQEPCGSHLWWVEEPLAGAALSAGAWLYKAGGTCRLGSRRWRSLLIMNVCCCLAVLFER